MLCTKEKCTGCLSCLNICPKNAINLINDSQGFWQPEIDETKCIHCGLCHKSCPVFFKPATEVFSSKVYACWHKDEKCRQQAASGGLFTALMQNALKRGFLNANFLRPSCYSCDYTTLKRYSDLTIGDFWNYFADGSDDVDDDKGISLLLINNANGQNLFNSAKSDLIYFAKDFERSTATSPRLHSPTKKPVTYESFWQDYKIHDFAYMIQKYF